MTFLLTLLIAVEPMTPEEHYRRALENRADARLAQPHLIAAAEAWEARWDHGEHTPSIAVNAGRARALAGDLARAIRNLRRGLAQFPHDVELRQELDRARGKVLFPEVGELADCRPRATRSPFDRIPIPIVMIKTLALLLAGFGWWQIYRGSGQRQLSTIVVGVVVVVIGIVMFGSIRRDELRQRDEWQSNVVIAVRATDVRSGNAVEYPRRVDGKLPAGAEARRLTERGGWIQVELPNGTIGWIREEDLLDS